MSIASALGLASGKKIRYAIVGLGDISQEALLPGVAHTGNSEVTALVSGDLDKARKVAEMYDITEVCDYDGFEALLRSGKIDAVYIGTPNWRHAEFVLPALAAGIHVLCEKPFEISVEKCQQMLDAQKASTAKLMVAYRLHFEPATLDAIARIRSGDLGELVLFTSCFAQMLDPGNHRADNGVYAGPLFDMAPYPINAARYLFGEEPTEVVSAVASRHPEAGYGDLDDTFAVTLRFPGNKLAQFSVSYYGNALSSLIVAGTKGSLHLSPAFAFGKSLEQNVIIGDKQTHESFKSTDQFGGELRYFSDCILDDVDPEPDAEEGLADLRVIEGALRAMKSGKAEVLPPFERSRRIDVKQVQKLSTTKAPELVDASDPSR